MRRIGLVVVLMVSLVLAPLTLGAQQPAGKVWHLGVLNPSTTPSEAARRQSPLIQRLNELGYVENQNLLVEYRYADGKIDRLAGLAIELVQQKVDAILTFSSPGVQAARKATGSIPIVFTGVSDPVGLGLVASLAHPGGNATGVSTLLTGDLVGKQLQILKEVIPRVARVATLWNPANPGSAAGLKETEAVAPALGIRIVPVTMKTPAELDVAVATILSERPDALLISSGPFFFNRRVQMAHLATRYAIPAIGSQRPYPEAGGLMSYGASLIEAHRQAGVYVGRILKGAKPADLPVVQSSKFELVINAQTARNRRPPTSDSCGNSRV